ncbi:MAG TPA: acetyl/propionyl/methylcrotonyl-CoA carboxylase subunit alpha [Methylocella sp.]|nr:acetyl/propionyl/methylcrotonyl-CoA carboxylase subunit alpha [Methylocella sp.]
MFSKTLIANRGEIACRITKTARRLGIATVAVYSDADRACLHVAVADEAFRIGPPPARESYLDGAKILAVAQRCGAQAIHPGYGFLAENAEFAEACAKAGVVFIGPPASAIRAMGDKAQANALMQKAGVPMAPGYHGGMQDEALLAREALRVGYPVLLKPSAGGGGKGMKIAEGPADFYEKLTSAKREALSAFGDERIILEKYLLRPRHVEVQIFSDNAGNFVHLFDRDCSLQRRHQKIVEEAPAPQVPEALRQAMREAALRAARAVGYVGAGTVEFMFSPEDGAFYFLEMNTRLQVEHPVTEMISGLDLVEWQIRVAAGGNLPLRQEEISGRGAAVEARLYAEDPARGFLPQAGRLAHLRFPDTGPFLRVDTGFRAGDEIPVDYDPMIAKVVAWGADREEAVLRLGSALGEVSVAGPSTNLELLAAIAADESFLTAPQDTGFVERSLESLLPGDKTADARAVTLAAIGLICERRAAARESARRSPDPWSPWNKTNGWRLNGEARETLRLYEILPDGGREHRLDVTYLRQGFHFDLNGARFFCANGELAGDGTLEANFDGHRFKTVWLRHGQELLVFLGRGTPYRFDERPPVAAAPGQERAAGRLTAPMPGRIAALLVAPGERVAANQPLLVLEAMKMEHLLRAPKDGIVKKFNHQIGDQALEGDELVTFESGNA